jgi:hypothetical protein
MKDIFCSHVQQQKGSYVIHKNILNQSSLSYKTFLGVK